MWLNPRCFTAGQIPATMNMVRVVRQTITGRRILVDRVVTVLVFRALQDKIHHRCASAHFDINPCHSRTAFAPGPARPARDACLLLSPKPSPSGFACRRELCAASTFTRETGGTGPLHGRNPWTAKLNGSLVSPQVLAVRPPPDEPLFQ